MTNLLALAHVRLLNIFEDLRNREEGQGLTEYTVLVGGVVVMVIALVAVLQTSLTTYISDLIDNLPTP